MNESGFFGSGIGPQAIRKQRNVASWTVTTTGAATHTIAAFTVSASTVVDWGDGSTSTYTGSGARTHNYAGAGTWTVRVMQPLNVLALTLSDNKVVLNSSTIKFMSNMATFEATAVKSGRFDSADVAAWRPTSFYLYGMPSGYAGTFDSADVAAWRPTTFYLYGMPSGYAGTFDSADVAAWRPTTFYLYGMPSGYAGTFDSADVAAWRPTTFRLYAMPSGYAGTFDSADVSAWRPTTFVLYAMPAGYAGTFDSADVSAWRPTTFQMLAMPAGYAGTFDSADVSAWSPTSFKLYGMPSGYAGTFDSADVSAWRPTTFQLLTMPSGYTITAGGGFAGWTTTTDFLMHSNALSQATVNAILYELYQASAAPRTASGGTINVAGTNAAPSGTFQAVASPPVSASTPGKEIAYELLNDSLGLFNNWATVTITA